jgi:fluoroacetyl-CoA thioesterase
VHKEKKEQEMKETLQAGLEHTFVLTIDASKLVPALFPEADEFKAMPDVFATGYMVGLIEWTCIQAVNPHLDWPAEQTVGTHIDVSHTAATPAGFDVTVTVKLIEVDGRRLVFEVEAHDGIDRITSGRHERFVIDKERFESNLEKKK